MKEHFSFLTTGKQQTLKSYHVFSVTQASSIKGVFFLSIRDRLTNSQSFIFGKNTILQTFGYFDASAIYIRSLGRLGQSVYTTVPDTKDSNLFCTGYLIESNLFQKNQGCPLYAGAVFQAECLDYNQQPDYANDTYIFRSVSSMKSSYMAVSYTSPDILTMPTKFLFGGYTYQVDFRMNYMRLNNAYDFGASGGFAVFDFNGWPRIYFNTEFYRGGGDAIRDLIAQQGYSAFTDYASIPYLSELMNSANINIYPTKYLSTSTIRIRRTNWVYMKNLTDFYTFRAESVYDPARTNSLLFNDYYGNLYIDYFRIQGPQGVLSDYLRAAGGQVPQPGLLQYGSMYGLMKFLSTDRVDVYFNGVSSSSSWGLFFQYIRFVQDFGDTLFPNFTNSSNIYVKQFSVNYLGITNSQCFNCLVPWFEIACDTVSIKNSYIQNYNTLFQLGYSQSQIFKIWIKKPYKNSAGTLITPTVTISAYSFSTVVFGEGNGRIFDFQYLKSTNEIEPSTYQVQLTSMPASYNLSSASDGPLIRADIDSMGLYVSSINIYQVYATKNSKGYTRGGLILLESAEYVYLYNMQIRQFYSWANKNETGGGSFLYYNQNKSFNIYSYYNNFWCSLSADLYLNHTFYLNALSNSQYFYGSAIYINTQNASLYALFAGNYFQNCLLAEKGAAIRIELGGPTIASDITIFNNYFLQDFALYGGSIYCKYCSITNLTGNNNYDDNAIQGAWMYLEQPTSNTLFSNTNFFQSSLSYGETVPQIFINDSLSTSTDTFSFLMDFLYSTTSSPIPENTISYKNVQAGALIQIYSKASINISLTSFLVYDINVTDQSLKGGIFRLENPMNSSEIQSSKVNVSIYIKNSTFELIGSLGPASLIHVSSSYYRSYVQISSSTINSTSQYMVGNLFSLRARFQNTVNSSNLLVKNYQTLLQGGIFYMEGLSNYLNFNSGNNIAYLSSQASGALAYLNSTNQSAVILNSTTVSYLTTQSSGGLLAFEGGQNVSIQVLNSNIQNVITSGDGGIFQVLGAQSSRVYIEKSSFANVQISGSGGICSIEVQDKSEIIVNNSQISSVVSQNKGGFALVSSGGSSSFSILKSSVIKSLQALKEGAILSSTSINGFSVSIQNSQLEGFVAGADGCLISSTEMSGANMVDIQYSSIGGILCPGDGQFLKMSLNKAASLSASVNSFLNLSNSRFYVNQGDIFAGFPLRYSSLISQLSDNSTLPSNIGFFLDSRFKVQIQSQTNIFKTLYPSQEGSYFWLNENMTFNDFNSSFTQNAAKLGGSIFCDSCNILLNQTSFTDGFGQNGGVLYLKNQFAVTLVNVHISYSKSTNYGGAIFIVQDKVQTEQQTATLSILGNGLLISKLEYTEAVNSGGFIYADHPGLEITISGSQLLNSFAGVSGGLIHAQNLKLLILQNLTIKNISSFQGSLLFSVAKGLPLQISSLGIQCEDQSKASDTIQALYKNYDQFKALLKGSLFHIENALQLIASQNTFKNCYELDNGGIYFLSSVGKFQDTSSSYQQITGSNGGVGYFQNTTVDFQSTIFNQIYALNGGSLYLKGQNNLTLENITILNTTAYQDGGFAYILENSSENVTESAQDGDKISLNLIGQNVFSNCQTLLGNGGCFYLDAPSLEFELVTPILLQNLTAGGGGGLIYAVNAKSIVLENQEVFGIQSSQVGGALIYSESKYTTLHLSNLTINCVGYKIVTGFTISSESGQIQMGSSNYERGAVFHILNSASGVEASSINASQCTTMAVKGGVYYLENTSLRDQGASTFVNNQASYGSVIYCKNCSVFQENVTSTYSYSEYGGYLFGQEQVNIQIRNLIINTTTALFQGGLFNLQSSSAHPGESTINITGTISFISNSAQQTGGLFELNNSDASVYLNAFGSYPDMFIDSNEAINGNGGIFRIYRAKYLEIQNATVSSLQTASYSNGSFIYSESPNFVANLSKVNIVCQIDVSINQSGIISQGGAIYISKSQNTSLFQNVSISKCQQAQNGGAYSIVNSSASISNSILSQNDATYGGAIYCESCELILENITFSLNQGQFGGTLSFLNGIKNTLFKNLTIINSTSYGTSAKGGAIYINDYIPQFQTQNLIKLQEIKFINIYSSQLGGSFYINASSLNLEIGDVSLTNSTAQSGGVFYIQGVKTLRIKSPSSFNDFKAINYGSFLLQTGQAQVSLDSVVMICVKDINQTSSAAQVFNLNGASLISLNNMSLSNCSSFNDGGVFKLVDVKQLSDNSSQYINCQTQQNGGFLHSTNSSSSFNNLTLRNFSSYSGTGFYLVDSSPLSIQNSYFDSFFAQDKAGLLETSQSLASLDPESSSYSSITPFEITIANSNFSNFKAGNYSAGFYLQSYFLQNLNMRDVSFLNFSASENGALFYITKIRGNVKIQTQDPTAQNTFKNFSTSSTIEKRGTFLYSEAPELTFILQNSLIQCSANLTAVKNYLLQDVIKVQSSSTFVVLNSKGIQTSNNLFQYCLGASQGGVFYLEQTQLSDLNSKVKDISAFQGGYIYALSSVVNLFGTQISNALSYQGSVFFMIDNTTIRAVKTEMTDNTAIIDSSILHSENIYVSIKAKSFYSFDQSVFKNGIVTSGNGGFGVINNDLASFSLSSSVIQNFSSSSTSGFLSTADVLELNVTSTSVIDIRAQRGVMIFSQSENLKLSIVKSSFICDSDYKNNEQESLLNQTVPTFTQFSTFEIIKGVSVNILKSSFSQCGVAKTGGVFYLSNTQFSDDGSSFFENAATQAGAIDVLISTVLIKNSKFYQNIANRAGAIQLSSSSVLSLQTSEIYKNLAYSDSGALYIQTGSLASISATDIYQNQAKENSIMMILEAAQNQNITIDNCQIYSNSAEKNGISIIKSFVEIKNSRFNQNFATSRSKNIFVGLSYLYISKTTFLGEVSSSKNVNDQTRGAFLYAIVSTTIIIDKSIFRYGTATYGGAIYITGDSLTSISNSEFTKNKASVQGGAIYASGFKGLHIFDGGSFDSNLASAGGDDIYATNSVALFQLESVTFNNPLAQLSIYASYSMVNFSKIQMTNIGTQQNSHTYSTGLYCVNCFRLTISNSVFDTLNGGIGGIIYIEETTQNRDSSIDQKNNKTKYSISNSRFLNSQGIAGGALYLYNPQSLSISNCLFQNNSAFNSSRADAVSIQASGGAIFFDCDQTAVDCILRINGSTQFASNYAERQGGALHWEEIEPIIAETVTFQNNKAYQYGNDLSCFSQMLALITKDKYTSILTRLGYIDRRYLTIDSLNYTSQLESTVSKQRSGGILPDIYLSLVDKYGQIVSADSTSKIRANVDPLQVSSYAKYPYTASLDGQLQFQVTAGVALINQIQFTGTPGISYRLVFTTTGIDLTKVSNIAYQKSLINSSDISFNLDLSLRLCEIGEYFTQSGQCLTCPSGYSYSLQVMNAPGSCSICPTDKAVCKGGANIGPLPGFWRSNNVSSNFIRCNFYYACLGMVAPDQNPLGKCQDGYQGIICADCAIGFSRQGDYKCAPCPKQDENILRLFFIFLAIMLLVAFVVRSTLNGAKEKRNVTNIFVKIMMNHLQLIILTASFNLSWPAQVVSFFQAIKPVSQVATQVFSFDCFVDTRTQDEVVSIESYYVNDNNPFRIFYIKLFLFSVVPFMIVLVSVLFWSLNHKLRKLEGSYRNKIITTCVILLFLVHPSIVQYMFDDFSCDKIDDTYRLTQDLQIICWQKVHTVISYFIALPSIMVWGLGIPIFAFILLNKNSKKLDSIEVRQRLGFLYRGYRFEYYYWEIVIVFRKLMIVFVRVFISSYGVTAQALIVFVVLVILLALNLKAHPFFTEDLNNLENVSLTASIVTIYCGIFFLANLDQGVLDVEPELKTRALKLSQEALLFFFVLILLSNIIFFGLWLYKIYSEVEMKLIDKIPRLYMFFCQCGNVEAFQKHKAKLQLKESNENLKVKFKQSKFSSLNPLLYLLICLVLKSVVTMYKKGELILNSKNIEKLDEYLSDRRIVELMRIPLYDRQRTKLKMIKDAARRSRVNSNKFVTGKTVRTTAMQLNTKASVSSWKSSNLKRSSSPIFRLREQDLKEESMNGSIETEEREEEEWKVNTSESSSENSEQKDELQIEEFDPQGLWKERVQEDKRRKSIFLQPLVLNKLAQSSKNPPHAKLSLTLNRLPILQNNFQDEAEDESETWRGVTTAAPEETKAARGWATNLSGKSFTGTVGFSPILKMKGEQKGLKVQTHDLVDNFEGDQSPEIVFGSFQQQRSFKLHATLGLSPVKNYLKHNYLDLGLQSSPSNFNHTQAIDDQINQVITESQHEDSLYEESKSSAAREQEKLQRRKIESFQELSQRQRMLSRKIESKVKNKMGQKTRQRINEESKYILRAINQSRMHAAPQELEISPRKKNKLDFNSQTAMRQFKKKGIRDSGRVVRPSFNGILPSQQQADLQMDFPASEDEISINSSDEKSRQKPLSKRQNEEQHSMQSSFQQLLNSASITNLELDNDGLSSQFLSFEQSPKGEEKYQKRASNSLNQGEMILPTFNQEEDSQFVFDDSISEVFDKLLREGSQVPQI